MAFLRLFPEKFARDGAPRDKLAIFTQCREKAINAVLPNEILVLAAHSNEGHGVPVWDWHDKHLFKTAHQTHIVGCPATIYLVVVARCRMTHPHLPKVSAEERMKVDGG